VKRDERGGGLRQPPRAGAGVAARVRGVRDDALDRPPGVSEQRGAFRRGQRMR